MIRWVNLQIALAHLLNRRRQSLVSILGVALGVGFFIGTFLALPIIQRVGHIRAFAFCAALNKA